MSSLLSTLGRAAAAVLRTIPNSVLSIFGTTQAENGARLAPDVRVTSLALSAISNGAGDGSGAGDTAQDVIAARSGVEFEASMGAGPSITVGRVWDDDLQGVPVRHYRPEGADGALPAVVYFHGGGWATGSLDSHDNTCRFLCRHAGVAVVSVDYPLAPEHKFPAGVDASDDAADAVLAGEVHDIDPARVAFAGDSAGGTMAAVVCLRRAARHAAQPALQALFVPATDLSSFDTASHREFATGTYLTDRRIEWFRDLYTAPSDDLTDWAISPLLAPPELLGAVAPAYIAVAGFDPLRDDGARYAAALRHAGVPATLTVHDSLVHPFANAFAVWRDAEAAMHQAAGAIRLALRVLPGGVAA